MYEFFKEEGDQDGSQGETQHENGCPMMVAQLAKGH